MIEISLSQLLEDYQLECGRKTCPLPKLISEPYCRIKKRELFVSDKNYQAEIEMKLNRKGVQYINMIYIFVFK